MSNRRKVGDVKPSSLNHLIGQHGVIDQIRVAIDAAHMDAKKFDHALLVGPPGLGKSALANVIAQEMAADFHEILGQSISGPADLNALLLSAKKGDVIHIDEAHELGKEYQTALYLALDKRTLMISGKGRSPQSLPLSDFSLLLSTTDEYGLLQPLRDRMKLVLRLQFYTEVDLTTVLIQRCRALGWDIHEEILPKISQRSRGTPRLALRLLQSCHRVCRSEGEDTITARHLQRACELEGIDEIGLGPTERQYVELLADGATRLNVLASALGLPSRTVSEVVEPFLIRANLVMKDDQGRRQLTQKGHDHLSNCRRDAV